MIEGGGHVYDSRYPKSDVTSPTINHKCMHARSAITLLKPGGQIVGLLVAGNIDVLDIRSTQRLCSSPARATFRMAVPAPNPLLSTGRASDSSLAVKLHPLVLLTISDYITRHTLTKREGPILGAIVGQQNGREVTMEHAFECKIQPDDQGRMVMDHDWFAARIEQCKDYRPVVIL